MKFDECKVNKNGELVLLMDGEEHLVEDPSCCDEGKCKCGGLIHFQPVYGGQFRRCDKCGKYV